MLKTVNKTRQDSELEMDRREWRVAEEEAFWLECLEPLLALAHKYI